LFEYASVFAVRLFGDSVGQRLCEEHVQAFRCAWWRDIGTDPLGIHGRFLGTVEVILQSFRGRVAATG